MVSGTPGAARLHVYGLGMSDPKPEATEPDGAPAEDPTGAAAVDNSGGIEANEINPDLPLIDPTGGEAG
jgi:hypothetical protein